MPRTRRLVAGVVLLAAALVPGAPGGLVPGTAAGMAQAGAAVQVDGRTDVIVTDGRGLQHVLDSLQPGQRLVVPAGVTVVHDRPLVIRVPGITLTGGGRLEARDEARSALVVAADRVSIENLTLATPTTTRRWEALEQHRLVLQGHQGISVTGIRIEGSAASGIFVSGSADFAIENVTVSDTRADGIHVTGGAARGRIYRPSVFRSGDDGVAVVSYDGTDPCRDIDVIAPFVSDQTGGRGLSVVGGRNVTLTDVRVERSPGAAVYVASESSYVTRGVRGVTVSGGVLSGSNTDPSIDHGAVLIYAGRVGSPVKNVTVRDLAVVGTAPGASAQLRVLADPGSRVHHVRWRDIVVSGSAAKPYEVTGNAARVSRNGVRARP